MPEGNALPQRVNFTAVISGWTHLLLLPLNKPPRVASPAAMAEPRRIRVTTLSSDPPAPAGTPDAGTGTGTVRLVVALFEPDERNFAEFSYKQLLDNEVAETQVKSSRDLKISFY